MVSTLACKCLAQNSPPRKKPNRRPASNDRLTGMYDEMLDEALSSSSTKLGRGEKIKRRRIGGRIITRGGGNSAPISPPMPRETIVDNQDENSSPSLVRQMAYTESDESSEDDVEWEDVLPVGEATISPTHSTPGSLDLVLEVGTSQPLGKPAPARRKVLTAAERSARLSTHKLHLLCALVHLSLRNCWCNDPDVRSLLQNSLPKRILRCFDDCDNLSQLQRSQRFIKGLEQACESFKGSFKITDRGISRAYWADNGYVLNSDSSIFDDCEILIDKLDFQRVARKLEGSRDVGAQLFCALLRCAGVETRLLCSLQVLPFTNSAIGTRPATSTQGFAPGRPDLESPASDNSQKETKPFEASNVTPGIQSSLSSRFRRSPFLDQSTKSPRIITKPNVRKHFQESPFPVFWVEAFDNATQQWIAVDPLVTQTIGKPLKLEPPANDLKNSMIYVVAFEEDGFAKDVTRRYCKAYNAKTRKYRVEISKGGERWWRRAFGIYQRRYKLDRDQVEDAALASKDAREGMPRNIMDFKGHPYYALERHLKRNEIIHPKREVGTVSIGKTSRSGGRNVLEAVYRRRDVHIVKSADSWYRLGREIKPSEQPLKHVPMHRKRVIASADDTSDDEENKVTAMYAGFQTVLYKAPPVVNGRVPKNLYGNLDLYVPTMLPLGGSHITHTNAAKAARLLGIDYSDAVIGFDFKGGRGTAVVKGAVVAIEFKEAVEEVICAYEFEEADMRHREQITAALRMWKRFLIGLRIKDRINGYETFEGEDTFSDGDHSSTDVNEDKGRDEDEDGDGDCFMEREELDSTRMHTGKSSDGHLQDRVEILEGHVIDRFESPAHSAADTAIALVDPAVPTNVAMPEFQSGGFFLETADDMVEVERQAREPVALVDASSCSGTESQLRCPQNTAAALQNHANIKNTTSISEPASIINHYLSPHALKEAIILQQIHDGGMSNTEPLSGKTGIVGSAEITGEEAGDSKKHALATTFKNNEIDLRESKKPRLGEDEQAFKSALMPEPDAVSENDSELEKGSLLSYDPSDEEADPDWLA